MRLHELQRQFRDALHYQAKGETCDISQTHFEADKLIQIYRNNFIIGLSEVLDATYPMLKALLGDQCFEQIARQHVLTNPLLQSDVCEYGEGLEQTLHHFPQVVAQVPYSSEVARLEWAIDRLRAQVRQQEVVQPEFALEALADLSQHQHGHVCFTLKRGLSTFTSDFALFSLYHAIDTQEFSGIDIQTAEQGVLFIDSDESLTLQQIDSELLSLIASLQQAMPLSELSQTQLTQLPHLLQFGWVKGFSLINTENI